MSAAVDILCLISTCITPDNELFTVKYASNLETLYILGLNFPNNIYFQSLEVVCRGSETELLVPENLNWMSTWAKGWPVHYCSELTVELDF